MRQHSEHQNYRKGLTTFDNKLRIENHSEVKIKFYKYNNWFNAHDEAKAKQILLLHKKNHLPTMKPQRNRRKTNYFKI